MSQRDSGVKSVKEVLDRFMKISNVYSERCFIENSGLTMFVNLDVEKDTGYRLLDWHGSVDLFAHEVVLVLQQPEDLSVLDVLWPDVSSHNCRWVRDLVIPQTSPITKNQTSPKNTKLSTLFFQFDPSCA